MFCDEVNCDYITVCDQRRKVYFNLFCNGMPFKYSRNVYALKNIAIISQHVNYFYLYEFIYSFIFQNKNISLVKKYYHYYFYIFIIKFVYCSLISKQLRSMLEASTLKLEKYLRISMHLYFYNILI